MAAKTSPVQAAPQADSRNTHNLAQSTSLAATKTQSPAIGSVDSKEAAAKITPIHTPNAPEIPKSPTIIKPDEISSNALVNDDSSTQVSSSEDSGKPPSLGGKSTLSAMAFAMDEKESLRPDDSASLRDVQEEEGTSAAGSVVASSQVGSDTDARAFSDQLREIPAVTPQYPPQVIGGTSMVFGDGGPHLVTQSGGEELSITRGAPSVDNPAFQPDEKLLEALESHKDRLWVLKTEQDVIAFIKNASEPRLFLPPTNSFYRLLAHRIADYYLLAHQPDQTGSAVEMCKTPYTRLPVPLATITLRNASLEAPQPTIPLRKIMRRGGTPGTNTGSNSEGPSMTTSEAGGDSASDAGGSEAKKVLSREDREARYREARLRIFGSAEEAGTTEYSEPVSEDVSRASSTTGKKKIAGPKKARSDDDDGFQARSAYNQYYSGPGTGDGYGSEGLYYIPYTAMSSPGVPTYGQYSQMVTAQAQPAYGWPTQMYAVQPSLQPVPSPGQVNHGLSSDFQQGMQSFQNVKPAQQSLPSLGSSPSAHGLQPGFPTQIPQAAQHWVPAQPFEAGFQTSQARFANHNATTIPYAYGQLPAPAFQNGKPLANQHPIPGSFSRQQFNPQSQTFVPGGAPGPQYPVQQAPVTGFPSPVPQSMQISSLRGGAAPSPFQAYGTPSRYQGPPMHAPSTPSSGLRQPSAQHQQSAPSISAPPQQNQQQHPLPPQPPNPDSTIAKWGVPSHLPPKPPPPQRWLETHGRQLHQPLPSLNNNGTAAAAAARASATVGLAAGKGGVSGSSSPLAGDVRQSSPTAAVE